MKLIIPAAAVVMLTIFTSCSSIYKSGQTPDDVYFSPGKPAGAVDSRDEYAYTNPDDNYLRMKVQDRNRWNTIDDANYWYSYNQPYANLYYYNPGLSYGYNPFLGNSFSLGFSNYYGSPLFGGYPFWNTFNYGYGGYYNPYYSGYYGHGFYGGGYYPGTVIVNNVRSNTGPKPYMGSYQNNNFNNNNYPTRNSGLGRFINSAVNNNGSNRSTPSYNNDYNRPVRTFTPSSSSSSMGSGSSSAGSSRSTGTSTGGGRAGRGN